MKKIITCLFFLLIAVFAHAQSHSERSVKVLEPHQLNQVKIILPDGEAMFKGSAMAEVPLENIEPFLAYSIVWYTEKWGESSQMNALWKVGKHGLHPQEIHKETHATPKNGQHISQLYFTEKNVQKVRLAFTNTALVERIEIHFFSPGETEVEPTLVHNVEKACPCPQPGYLDRLGWCPDGTCPKDATPTPTTVTHLIVHHSAGSNTSTDWAATVRSIYDFHVFTNGWDDIGYNWLVDPNGVIYEGRGDNVLGAHFCGQNGGTMGVCMIGDYTSVLPTTSSVSSLEDLLAWKVCDAGVTADGAGFHASSGGVLMYISGHRDGCSTACPGDTFYPTLGAVRTAVKLIIDNECEDGLVLNAPSNVEAFLNPDEDILVTWDDNSDNEDGFQLERSFFTNGNYTPIADLPANTTSYVDSPNPNFTYYYRLRATLGPSFSDYSDEGIYTPPSSSTDIFDEKSVQVFPNPTDGLVNVSIENGYFGEVSVAVLNVMGQVVLPEVVFEKTNPAEKMEVDLSALEAGVYVLKIRIEGQEGLVRVVRF